MRLAFAIPSLFLSGGLQRDCLRLAELAVARGHEVTIFTADLREPVVSRAHIAEVRTTGFTNPGRDRCLGERLAVEARDFDRVVGFNKMPHLDILYCADPPFGARRSLSWCTPRYLIKRELERHCFSPGGRTALMLLSRGQADAYRTIWNTPADRIVLVGPTLDARRRRPDLRQRPEVRARVRATLGVQPETLLWLAVAATPRVKGIDRTIDALRHYPDAVLAVAGASPGSPTGQALLRLAGRRGVQDRIRILGHCEEMPELMAGADLLVHPARLDTTGTVILEAIANGLPVIVSAACGFAAHVQRAGAGLVGPEPFDAAWFAGALAVARDPARRAAWSGAGQAYGRDPLLSSGHAQSIDLITGPLWGRPRAHPAGAGTRPAWQT